VVEVVVLALADDAPAGGGCGACPGGGGACAAGAGTAGGATVTLAPCAGAPAVPEEVAACVRALAATGAAVELVTATATAEIDAVLARLDGPVRPDGLAWPAPDGVRLVLAASEDSQVRAVVRRLVRRYAPPPSRRPADLPAGRTVPDLPALAILPVPGPAGTGPDLVRLLGLPPDPQAVAAAVGAGRVQRLDLLRHDGGSVTLGGAVLGQQPYWHARVEVDDVVLARPDEPLLVCVVTNAGGYAQVGGLSLAPAADPADGQITVAVAVPVPARRWGRRRPRVEVRRATGRAVAVTPRDEVAVVDDGVAGTLARRRSWWIEVGAWAVRRP